MLRRSLLSITLTLTMIGPWSTCSGITSSGFCGLFRLGTCISKYSAHHQVLSAIEQCTVAGAVATWYFADNKRKLGWPIVGSFWRTIRYHLGSLALGALLIAIVQVFRILLAYVQGRYVTRQKSSNFCQAQGQDGADCYIPHEVLGMLPVVPRALSQIYQQKCIHYNRYLRQFLLRWSVNRVLLLTDL